MSAELLVIQNAEGEGLGHLEAGFRDAGLSWRTVDAWDGDRVPSTIAPHLGLVILGGPQRVWAHEQWPYLEREMGLIREAHAIRAPVLGICLGAQLVAHALGGRALQGAAKEEGFTRLVLAPEAANDPVMRAVTPETLVYCSHQDTYELPPGAVRLASTKPYAEQAFRLGDRTYGLQFHPEVTLPMVKAMGGSVDLVPPGLEEVCRGIAAGFAGCGCFD